VNREPVRTEEPPARVGQDPTERYATGSTPLASSGRGRQHHLDESRRGRLAEVTAAPQRSETVRAGRMAAADTIEHLFVVPSPSVHRIQEVQTTTYHVLWELTQQALG